MRVPQFIAVTWLALVFAIAPANAEKRVALVIGNGAYVHADRLDNPVNDARGMHDALKQLGFEVIYGQDLDLKGLGRVIGQFAGRVDGADVAIVYFAGHGATFDGTSYVAPVDAEFASLTEVIHELVPVETLIADLRQAKGVRIAILDACRDNGAEQELKRHASRGGGDKTRGLAPMKNASGLIIAYATQYGATAADAAPGGLFSWMRSSTGHSPFTSALLNNIAMPGLDVTDMFRKVGREVDAATAGKQRPEIAISMYEQYALVPGATAGGGGVSPLPSGPSTDEVAWSFLKDTKDPEQLRRFIAQYPTNLWRREAEGRLKALEQMAVVLPSRPAETVKPAGDPCSGPVTASFPSRCAAPLTSVFASPGR